MRQPLPIRLLGDPILERPCAPVVLPDAELKWEARRLHATLDDFRRKSGFGRAIAAPQVGISKRIVAMNLGAGPITLINPDIFWRSSEEFEVWDDCLSIPDRIVLVKRQKSVSLRYTDEQGYQRTWARLPPDLAELVQHETDHLDGILMTSRAIGPDAVQPIDRHAELIGNARPKRRLSLENIQRAASAIDPVFRSSPHQECESLNRLLECRLTLKVETLNPIRSFKGRGADFLLSQAVHRRDNRELVCASAGNWGQALAYAARKRGRRVTVYAAETANPRKLEAIRQLGANLRISGNDFDAAKEAARAYATSQKAWFVEDGFEPEISEGVGSIAIEMIQRTPRLDAVLVPIGNGALINGVGRWIKAASPATRVIGVCAETADSMKRSFDTKNVVETASAETIADGIAVRVPILESVQDMYGIVDEVRLVSDDRIRGAMQLLREQAGLIVEPAGAVGVAALLDTRAEFANSHVATILSGGNV